jgi:peptidoglycan hydrolase-like protein with peptidoglycan-binding domain
MALRAATNLSDPAERKRLLGYADRLLKREGAPLSRWPALLNELQASEAERGNRPDEAREYWLRAAELYEGLADDTGRRRMMELSAPSPLPPVAENEVRATVRVRDVELTVETQWKARPPSLIVDPGEGPLFAALLSSGAVDAGAAAHSAIVRRLLEDRAAAGAELASPLLAAMPTDLTPTAGRRYVDIGRAGLRLFRRAPRTRGEPGDLRALQGALNRLRTDRLATDGILGPRTKAALGQLQLEFDLPVTGDADAVTVQKAHASVTGGKTPRVAIVRPTLRTEDLTFRGARQGGVPLELFYERAGFRPNVLDGPTPDELEAELRRRPAAIVHLTIGMVDHHGTAAVDLLAAPPTRGRPSYGARLTATMLGSLIPRELPSPLVIVDVPAPPGGHEAVKQLLLRNAFSAEAMAVGTIRALLATGLARYGRQQRLYEVLVGKLKEGGEVGELARAVQRLATGHDSLDGLLAFSATALFARTPDVRFPAPG